jgi:hypothetical protein
LALLVLAAAWAAGVPALKRFRRARRRAGAGDGAGRVLVAWDEATEALGVTRVGRRPSETMAEYAGRASRAVPLAEAPSGALATLADDAGAASYGADQPSAESVQRAEAAATTVTTAARDAVTARRRLLWAIDPRPLFSRRRA